MNLEIKDTSSNIIAAAKIDRVKVDTNNPSDIQVLIGDREARLRFVGLLSEEQIPFVRDGEWFGIETGGHEIHILA